MHRRDPLTPLSVRAAFPRFSGEDARRNTALLAPISAIADARGLSMAQVALAWLHQQAIVHGTTVVPIPGTRNPSRLRENLAASGITLTSDELLQLEPIAQEVSGDPYPDMQETASARES